MAYSSYLTPSQYETVRKVFTDIYDALSRTERGKLCRKIGLPSKNAWHVRQGIHTLPVTCLKAMYLHTGYDFFRLTPEQKQSYHQHKRISRNMPSDEGWPDISPRDLQRAIDSLDEVKKSERDLELVAKLETVLSELAHELEYLSELGNNNPARIEAQARLLQPAMFLFNQATMLGLEYPEAFKDLRQQLEFASTIFEGKERRK